MAALNIDVFLLLITLTVEAGPVLAIEQREVRRVDVVLRTGLTDLVAGRKEILLDPRKGAFLVGETLRYAIARRQDVRAPFMRKLGFQTVASRAVIDVLIYGCMLAVVVATLLGVTTPPVTAMLLLFKLPFFVLALLPLLVSGEASIQQWDELTADLARAQAVAGTPRPADTRGLTVASIALEQVRFRHPHTTRSFAIGPDDLRIEAGTITFLTGANGSGKSTLLRIITGLYPPDGGVCRLNGAQVDLGSLRELFALVMFDQPLLDRIYGGADPDPARVNALLDAFGVGHVTSFEQGRFTRLDLSSGQRKRVGLVVALLEDKPVLVLDEWAAEQDPPMRERFYRELLPAYKRAGKTIIAVSHDDRYFDLCDQLVVMRDGRVDYAGPPQAIRVGRFL